MKPPPRLQISVADMLPHTRYKIVMPTGECYYFEFLERLRSSKIGFNRLLVRELFKPGPPARWIRAETPMAIRVDADLRDVVQ